MRIFGGIFLIIAGLYMFAGWSAAVHVGVSFDIRYWRLTEEWLLFTLCAVPFVTGIVMLLHPIIRRKRKNN